MDEINLDFLKTTPKSVNNNVRAGSPFVFNELDVNFGKIKCSKRLELASNIAKVDELLQEIDKLKSKNLELQQQLMGFHVSAQKVQELYKQEKDEHSVAKQTLEKLQKEHSKADENLENMSLVNEQLKARLAEYDGRPISFENLVVKYVKVMTKFQDNDANKYSQDKDLVEKLREYCTAMNYKMARAVSPKKSRSRGNKNKTQEAFVQCDLLEETSLKNFNCTTCNNKPQQQDQSIQCSQTKRNQASQYVNTMITRQTNTEKVAQKHVQTMFPETPAIADILNVYSKWVNIRSVSPLLESPTRIRPTKELLKSSSTIGTCTMLCNIRRKIDYLPNNSSSNIKQEFFTPSASPTPNAHHTATIGSRANTLSTSMMGNINTSSLFSLFNSTTNSSLDQLSFNAFNELWQIFGKMLLSLIKTSSADIASTNPTSQLNQQQFLDWLLELYTNSQAQNSTSTTTHSQTLDQRDSNVLSSPLIFNGNSVLSSNILRPQPQKTSPSEKNVPTSNERLEENNEIDTSNLVDNFSNNPISSTDTSDSTVESSTQIACSINHTIKQNASKTNNTQTINICESDRLEKSQNNGTKSDKKAKNKYKILDQIQELMPERKLNKKKRKSSKKLRKNNNHRKKSYENRTNKELEEVDDKQASVVILTNDNKVIDNTETAIDFLKDLAMCQQSNEKMQENISETEKIFFKQVSNDNINGNMANNFKTSFTTEESTFVKPSILVNRKMKISKQVENKYHQLFGESDSEEVEMEKLTLKPKPVININLDFEDRQNKRNNNNAGAVSGQNKTALETIESENCNQQIYDNLKYVKSSFDANANPSCRATEANIAQDTIINNDNILNFINIKPNTGIEILEQNQRCHITPRNAMQKSVIISENQFNSSQEILSIPDLSTQIFKDLECNYSPNIQFEIPKDLELICYNSYPQNIINTSLIVNTNSIRNIENSLANMMELSSAVDYVNENYENAPKTFENFKTEANRDQEVCLVKDIYNAFQRDNRTSEMLESYAKQDSIQSPLNSIVQPVDIAEEVNAKVLPKLNDDGCSDDSLKSQPIIISSTTLYSSDFEKDLELSSDNESVKSENDISHKSISLSETNKSSSKEDIFSLTSSLSGGEDHQEKENSKLNLLKTELNISKEHSKIFSAKVKNDVILTSSPSKPHDIEKPHQTSVNELKKDSCEVHKIFETSIVNALENEALSIDSIEKVEENKNKTLHCKEKFITMRKRQTTEEKESNKEKLKKTFQTNVLFESVDESISTQNRITQNDNLKSLENYENEKYFIRKINSLEEEKSANKDYWHDKYRPAKTKEANDKISLNSNSIKLSHSQYSGSETINCSVITVSDDTTTTTNDESSKKEDTLTTHNQNDETDLPKTLAISALKLLDLNKTLKYHKSCNNLKPPNLKESNTKTELRDATKQTTIINTKERKPLKTGPDTDTPRKDVIGELNNEKIFQFPKISKTIGTEYLKTFSKKAVEEDKKEVFCCQQIPKKNNSKTELQRRITNQKHIAEQPSIKSSTTNFEQSFYKNINAMPNNKNPILYESMDDLDKFDLSDSLSIEDELMIDEEPNEIASTFLQSNPLDLANVEDENNYNDTLDSTNISTLLNSSLFNEVLSESVNPIVNDLLATSMTTPDIKSKRGRKRHSDCLTELQQPCKRSQRLKAKQMILEESLNLSISPIEFTTKFPYHRKNVLNTKSTMSKVEALQKCKMPENKNILEMGFFKERDAEDAETNLANESLNRKNTQETEAANNKTYTILEDKNNLPKKSSPDLLNLKIRFSFANEQDGQNSNSPDILAIKQPPDNFVYTDSPQSPPPVVIHNNHHDVSDPFVIIPLERPTQFAPQYDKLKLFDHLINSYKHEHQKQVVESVSRKESKHKEQILKQLEEQIKLYCYDEKDLELYCTSKSLINKLLSLWPDYHLIQKAVITVAQNAVSPLVTENNLPSIVQEMPPRHLSKCLQRLYTFLMNIVTRNDSFCQDLILKIEAILFNPKQTENLSLQATLNLTQLYLMASKVQEYLQVPKHPARLFIAKCLYYYLQKSIVMIHEVLIWYPTVLPHREDKTYDRSDALIIILQQILMNTKYDMDKPDLRGKLLISKLRFEYHFEPFKPTQEEVINVLVEKLKNSKFYNISLAFGLLCKRIGVIKTEKVVLNQHLLPLAMEYYSLALKTNEYDKRIEVLLEIISMLVKPMPIETDTKKYFLEFSRFLNRFERQIIQEAAVCAILRLQRFNVEYCYSLLYHFQPAYNLNAHTQAMLKSFVYRRPVTFWKNLKSKNLINCN